MLAGVISALASALVYIAKVAYSEMRAERDYLRNEILEALSAIVGRMNEVALERDQMAHNHETKLDNLQRQIVKVLNIVGKLGGVHKDGME